MIGQMQQLDPETAKFALQLGIDSVQLNTPLLDQSCGYWTVDSLVELRKHCEDLGLKLQALENVPQDFMRDIILGGPDRDRQIANYCTTIENMGRAGIPILGHNFNSTGIWRTSTRTLARGGALVSSFNFDDVPRGNAADGPAAVHSAHVIPISEEQLWANYEAFLTTTLPVAEASGVRLALHPDDPPVPVIGPTSHIFYDVAALERALTMGQKSPAYGFDLCLGTISEMVGGAKAVRDAIQHFGPAGAICYVHFRQVRGTVPDFEEWFLGEGNYSALEVLQLLADSGFDGFLLDDHVPEIVGDTPWHHRARAHAIGYMQGLLCGLSR